MSTAKILLLAGVVSAAWLFWDWVFGSATSLREFCLAQFAWAFVFWAVSWLCGAYQRRRARMQAEWEFYREVARSRDEA